MSAAARSWLRVVLDTLADARFDLDRAGYLELVHELRELLEREERTA